MQSLSVQIVALLRRLQRILDSFWTFVVSLVSQLSPQRQEAVIANVVPPPPPTDKLATCNYHGTPWWKTLAEMIGIGAVVTYTFVSCNQWKTAERQLEASERPWVSLDMNIFGPLIFDNNGANLHVRFSLRNYGHSPAMFWINARFYPHRMNYQDTESERRKLCFGPQPFAGGPYDETIFPSAENFIPRADYGLTSSKEDIDRMVEKHLIAPLVIACVLYHTSSNNAVRHTVRIYDIRITDPQILILKPEDIKPGNTVTIPIEHLFLYPDIVGSYTD